MDKSDEQKTFWERLSEAMVDAGKEPTQGAVADLLGIRQPSAYKYEHGGYPTLERAITLATKLNVNVEWLLTGRGLKRPMRRDTVRAVQLFEQLDNDLDRGEILGQLKSMLGVGRRKKITDPDHDPLHPF